MKKQINFWLLAIMIVLFVGFSSCGNGSDSIDNGNKEENEIDSLIFGQWHFYSGSARWLIGDSVSDFYDQILTFNLAGNYSEENISAKKDDTYNGNWSIKGKKITINDWNGKKLDSLVSITNLSENQLEISYLNSKAVYLRVGTEFENLKKDILGYWYEFTNTKNYYEFKNGGTARHVTVPWAEFPNVTQQGNYEWNIEGNTLTLKDLDSVVSPIVYTVIYCNDKYTRWKNKDIITDLKRTQ